jgi:hypothetical protein
MAYLIETQNHKRCYLYTNHCFGRLVGRVDTLVRQPKVSRIHVLIEWQNGCWCISDLSSNGTWLNYHKLHKRVRYLLQMGDVICLAAQPNAVFTVEDLSSPKDMIVPLSSCSDMAIELEHYQLLPNKSQPEIRLYFLPAKGQWCVEPLTDLQSDSKLLNEYDIVTFAGKRWQLRLTDCVAHSDENENLTGDLLFVFNLSLDEEATRLTLSRTDDVIDLDVRSHHYLTLNLARYRLNDINNDISVQCQGWISVEVLAKELGITRSHLNIQIHRAKKQYQSAINLEVCQEVLIERSAGKVRFAGSQIKVYKGGELQSATAAISL